MAERQETVSEELRRLRALEKALGHWVSGGVPAYAASVSVQVDGAEFVFGSDMLGRNPLALRDVFAQLNLQAHLVTAARAALAMLTEEDPAAADPEQPERVAAMLRAALKELRADG